MLAALLIWGGLSALWAIDPQTSIERLPRLFGVFLAGLVMLASVRHMRPTERAFLERALLASVIAGVVLLAVEIATDLAVFRTLRTALGGEPPTSLRVFNRAATVLALLLWPALAVLWKRGPRVVALAFLFAALATLSMLESFAAIAALGFAPGFSSRRWSSSPYSSRHPCCPGPW